MKRPYQVWTASEPKTKEIKAYFVSDITDEEIKLNSKKKDAMDNHEALKWIQQEVTRPRIATFPVSALYPRDEQERRAEMLCDYLNKIREAQEQAESEALFVDLLKAQHPNSQP